MKILLSILLIAFCIYLISCGAGSSSNKIPTVIVQMVNNSTLIADSDFPKDIAALQHQVTYDFAPWWRINALLTTKYINDSWTLTVSDGPIYYAGSQVGGFHEYDHLPYAEIDAHEGSTGISHELLEMLADPYVDRCAVGPGGNALEEVADPVASLYYIAPNGVAVNDFVTPNWFNSTASKPYDFNSNVKGQYQIAPWTVAHTGAQQLGFFYYGGC